MLMMELLLGISIGFILHLTIFTKSFTEKDFMKLKSIAKKCETREEFLKKTIGYPYCLKRMIWNYKINKNLLNNEVKRRKTEVFLYKDLLDSYKYFVRSIKNLFLKGSLEGDIKKEKKNETVNNNYDNGNS